MTSEDTRRYVYLFAMGLLSGLAFDSLLLAVAVVVAIVLFAWALGDLLGADR